MGYLIEGYKILGKEIANYMVQHRAGIGTVVSIGGTITSNILSTKAGAKSARMIDAKQIELGRVLTMGEKVKLCWTNHIGSASTAIVSCVGAGYSHNQHVKDFNKVATAYGAVKKLYDSTRNATREVLGEKKNAELQDKINQKYIEEHPEVKKKITEERVNPNPSVLIKFWEPVSGEVFFSTVDRIDMAMKVMNAEMAAMKPRDASTAALYGSYGIKLSRFFDLIDHQLPQAKYISETFEHSGWNKGCEANGSDDDKIGAYFTPMMLDDDTAESCTAINWDAMPCDMRYGRFVKS